VLGSGCRDATQVTLDISLSKNALCTETHGTAIAVGVDPTTTEDRIAHHILNASTSSCDPATREIGTLVLTPSGSDRASVIVVVAYATTTADSCQPPLFKGCIVARRQFSFTDHRHLTMPISIDPDCRDVPCDAFSTCRSGRCFPSEAACSGDTCPEPGDPGDGGTAVDGQVIPDTGMPVDGSLDGSADGPGADGAMGLDSSMGLDGSGGTDGAPDTGVPVPGNVYCDMTGQLVCPDPFTCIGATSCCGPTSGTSAACRAGTATCTAGTEQQYCCMGTTTCPAAQSCGFVMVVEAGIMPKILPSWIPAGSSPAGVCR
jgi:hypothetical protein